MSFSKLNNVPHSKSYTSLFDLFRPTSLSLFKVQTDQSVFHSTCKDSAMKSLNQSTPSKNINFVTSEKYNMINNDSSCKTLAPSTSTIFYDLDDIAKRHSFHCLTELGQSNLTLNLLKVMRMNVKHTVFAGKSETVVQECATQINPKLVPRDSMEISSKKVKKKASRNPIMSSEIFLRDDDYVQEYEQNYSQNKHRSHKPQKFWSYSKYRTEYTRPIPKDKKYRNRDGDQRNADPCPCQLFSYACPCTDKKSLTELAKNTKSITVNHQVTSTSKILAIEKKDGKNNNNKMKRTRRDMVREDKPTNTSVAELIEVMVPDDESENKPVTLDYSLNKQDMFTDQAVGSKNNNKFKARKRPRKVLCPNCNEEVDVVISISTTEEEESLKYANSTLYNNHEIPSTTAYAYKTSPNNLKNKTTDDDLCLHEPPCEILPVCQILPNEFYNVNPKCTKKNSVAKTTPRIIRITKACRHHPPCTVVPSCQRANVLKNNCEYIPPCLHRPRCVNLPLCVPFSKSLHYEEGQPKFVDDIENSECPHIPRCKYTPVCQHDSLANLDHHQVNVVSRVQNDCDFFNEYNSPNFLHNPNCVHTGFSPYQFSPPPCHMCRSNKSCQFNCSRCKRNIVEESSDDAVVFIRDVGCQFRSKSYSPKNSLLQSKVSSNSFEFLDVKQMGTYNTNIHTVRCEDKFTNPVSGAENSITTVSITSVDSECPSHGRRVKPYSRKNRQTTGFHPHPAYVTAFSTMKEPELIKCAGMRKSDILEYRDCHNTYPLRSPRSYLKGKYKKFFSIRRRKKSRLSNHLVNNNLK